MIGISCLAFSKTLSQVSIKGGIIQNGFCQIQISSRFANCPFCVCAEISFGICTQLGNKVEGWSTYHYSSQAPTVGVYTCAPADYWIHTTLLKQGMEKFLCSSSLLSRFPRGNVKWDVSLHTNGLCCFAHRHRLSSSAKLLSAATCEFSRWRINKVSLILTIAATWERMGSATGSMVLKANKLN